MDFISFPEQNEVIAKDQPQYLPIPAYYVDKSPKGEIFMKIQPTPEELKQLNEQGHFWMSIWTFDNPLQPLRLFTESPFKQMIMVPVLTAEEILPKLTEGTLIGNVPYSKDQAVFKVASVNEKEVGVIKEFTVEKKIRVVHIEHLISWMKQLNDSDQWFIVNP